MKLHQMISYGLMTTGALISAKALLARWQWEENNVLAAIMLDWDDVHAVATRAAGLVADADNRVTVLENLLHQYKENGATHLSLPELTLRWLLDKGELSVTHGADPDKVYLRARDVDLAEFVTAELQARLPQLKATRSSAKNPLISFTGDLPTVAEVGLGFYPMHAELAQKIGLRPVPRPVGYSWVQPQMIERTLSQAAALGARVIAVQGQLIPGFEFNINNTVEAMRRHRLTFAYFSMSRHQRGDWFLAKNLAEDGLVVLAHEFEPAELLEEDWHTVSDRWANIALEAGIRFCSVRFFRVIHAADPLESIAYIKALSEALVRAGLVTGPAGGIDLTLFRPDRDEVTLVGAGLSTAGAAGLAANLLPIPDQLKLLGMGATALTLTALPFWEAKNNDDHHPHHHDHNHHHHDHNHHHHDHDHHGHDRLRATAYAPKGIALATAVAYPAATIAINGGNPGGALVQAILVGSTGVAALNATTTEADYVMGIETYRGYNLDWLLPVGLAAAIALVSRRRALLPWLPLAGVALATLRNFRMGWSQDMLAPLDYEHRHAHTHHLSAFQRVLGDSKMALSPKPLRKWSLFAPFGTVLAVLLKRKGQDELAAIASTAAAVGQVATLAGFRNGQRPFLKTLEGRARGWLTGSILAGIVWLLMLLWRKLS